MGKRYLYKAYRGNEFLGVMPNVTSDFAYSQDINTPGTEIKVELGASFDDTGPELDVDYLVTDTGDNLTDHDGNHFVSRKEYLFNDIAVDLGNRIKVFLYYDEEVNGRCVFDGVVTSLDVDYKQANMTLTVWSQGFTLDKEIFRPYSSPIAVSQESHPDTILVYPDKTVHNADVSFLDQVFQVVADIRVAAVEVYAAKNAGAYNTPMDVDIRILGQTASYAKSRPLLTSSTMDWVRAEFTSYPTLSAGVGYEIMVSNRYGFLHLPISVGYSSAGGYGYTFYSYTRDGGFTNLNPADLAFRIILTDGSIIYTYDSREPSDIVKDAINFSQSLGGLITYDNETIDTTNTVVSYDFKMYTILDTIKKALELAPAGWHWFVDVGTNELHFHPLSRGADHTLVFGQHIENLQIHYTLDNLKNAIWFSGGDVGGENLTHLTTNTVSINKYGVWASQITDGRVTDEDTAAIISASELNQYSKPMFSTTVTVTSEVYDIEAFQLGDIIGFQNFNEVINSLFLQVVSITRTPDTAILRLASLTPSVPHRIEDIRRNLNRLETTNNPDTI